MSSHQIDTVISDFGGVLTTPLADAFGAVQAAHGFSFELLGAAMAHAAERDGGVPPLFALERGEITEAEFTDRLSAALGAIVGRSVELAHFGPALFDALAPNHEMFDYMRRLRGRGYQMAILTNNVREWESRWRAMLPFEEVFGVIVDSAFVGMRKPEPEIYRLLLDQLDIAAERAVFVDDLEVNCLAAQALGIHAVQFRSTAQTIAELDALLSAPAPG